MARTPEGEDNKKGKRKKINRVDINLQQQLNVDWTDSTGVRRVTSLDKEDIDKMFGKHKPQQRRRSIDDFLRKKQEDND